MNYILIDTKTGSFGVVSSREKVEIETKGKITKSFLNNIFTIRRNKREIQTNYVDDRFILLPYREKNKMHIDEKLIHRIIAYR